MIKRILASCTLLCVSSLLFGSTGTNYFKCQEVMSPSDQEVWVITKPGKTQKMTARIYLKNIGTRSLDFKEVLSDCKIGEDDLLLECEGNNQDFAIFSDLTAEYLALKDFHKLKCCRTLRTLD